VNTSWGPDTELQAGNTKNEIRSSSLPSRRSVFQIPHGALAKVQLNRALVCVSQVEASEGANKEWP
jgi:hypothetical protein